MQTQITDSNKLASDLVDDSSQTNKFVTDTEKNTWNNKSDFSGSYNDLSNKPTIPTKTSDLSNDSGFITNAVNDLTNYYKKTDTYTQAEVNSLIGAISTMDIRVVETLPTQDISTTTIYLVPKTTAGTNDAYDEYIYVSNSWEHIGSTDIDLSDYYTKTETNTLLGGKQATIDSSHKLSADLVDDTSTTNKFVTSTDKTNWNAKYDKPSGGIPSTDMSSAVQTSLGKADTAIQDISGKQDVLTAGSNIDITNNVISATDTTYTAGTGIDITNNVISNTQTSAEWGNITGTLSNQTDLANALSGKQDTLVSGTNIKTVNSTSVLGSGDIAIRPSKVYYGTCSSSASDTTKIVTCPDFVLETGATIVIKFSTGNSVMRPMYNINNTNAIACPADKIWNNATSIQLVYDGDYYYMVNSRLEEDEVFVGDEQDAPETTKLVIEEQQAEWSGLPISNTYNTNTNNTYSCDYINTKANTYSTSEQIIGTWIDGKPLYRLVLDTTTGSSTGSVNVLYTNANINKIINVQVRYEKEQYAYPTQNNTSFSFHWDTNTHTFNEQHSNSYWNLTPMIIILEYTKTTD